MKARLPKQNQGGAQNMNAMIRQAQKMQDEISELQEEIEAREFSATAGGGAVQVVVTGKKSIKSLKILKCCRIWSSVPSTKPSTTSKKPPKPK